MDLAEGDLDMYRQTYTGRACAHLFAVLVRDDGALSGSRICTEHDAVLEETSYDGGTGAGCFGEWNTALSDL